MHVKLHSAPPAKLDPTAPIGSMWQSEDSRILYIVVGLGGNKKLLWCVNDNFCEELSHNILATRVPPGTQFLISEEFAT